MNCGRSSSVEWKLPKLQRRVRFPSPAPAPPGHAPGGFVMPTSHPPSTECGGQSAQHFPRASWGPRFRYKTRPARPARHQFRYKTRPTRATRRHFRYKTRPARPKSPNLARFALAGRVLSRFCCQQAEHGEFSPATTNNKPGTPPVPIQNSPCTPHTPPVPVQNSPHTPKISQFGAFYVHRANFVPLPPATRPSRHHSRYKTRPTRATRRHFRYKTRPARPKSPNLARFALAGRVLSRFCCQQAEHGEFCPAQTPAPPQARKKQHPHTTHKATR